MELRPYQQECLKTILDKMRQERCVLIQAATGAGKTILFSALVRHYINNFNMRIAIVAHREQLIRQAYDKLLKVWPEGMLSIGIACSSVSKMNIEDLKKHVVIGSPQTLTRHLDETPPFHLLIIDECHRVPSMTINSQYKKLIETLYRYYPKMRTLGVTATPYRLNYGYIYGNNCRKGGKNLFKDLTYQVSIETLINEGYLVPYRIMEKKCPDLSNVKKNGGEFSTIELEDIFSNSIQLESAVKATKEYAFDRKHIVIFCITIKHAEEMCKIFKQNGYSSAVVHSEQKQEEKMQNLQLFDTGKIQVICNVGILTEGWDCPSVDCMVMCRPTMSPALYVQMVGRGLRLSPGKKDCLLLDLSGNYSRHGDPNSPSVIIPGFKVSKKPKDKEEEDEEEDNAIICPKCQYILDKDDIRCPRCGSYIGNVNNERLELIEIKHKDLFLLKKVEIEKYRSAAGNDLLRIRAECYRENSNIPNIVYHYVDIEGNASSYGKDRARRFWVKMAGKTPPDNLKDAIERKDELVFPKTVKLKRDKNFTKIVGW